MSKTKIFGLLLLMALWACKSSSTNPTTGQKLRLISSDLDTTFLVYGPVTFTVTVLAPSGYGASGAYIDFYDPIQQRARHEGPTPEDGTWQFTDTIVAGDGGNFEFAFVTDGPNDITSDSLRLWVHAKDIRLWIIDSIRANSWSTGEIGVQWLRPSIDSGVDTIVVHPSIGAVFTQLAPYPQNKAVAFVQNGSVDTITIHNAFASSKPIIWASAVYSSFIQLYSNMDTSYPYCGLLLSDQSPVPMNPSSNYRTLADLELVADNSNQMSGFTIISPSLSSLSGFSGGKTTRIYHPVQFIDTGFNLQELYYTNDLSTYINGVTPVYEIPLPDSSKYSTAFIAVTEDGNYAQVCISPVTRDWQGTRMVTAALSYQTQAGLPYAGRGRKR